MTPELKCLEVRKLLIETLGIPELIVLLNFTDQVPMAASVRSEVEKSAEHLRSCSHCNAWVKGIVPEPIYTRQSRLARYCCPLMFGAVEEPHKPGTPRIAFTMFCEVEPCWQIDGKDAFLQYCPWCGKKLPDRPFIS